MGKLSGFKYREVIKKLKRFGFVFLRSGKGSHQIFFNILTNRYITVPKHTGDIPEGTLKSILDQADISVDEFLAN